MAVNVALVRFAALVLGFFGGLFIILATPTHHWYTKSTTSNGTIYGGIWEDCREGHGTYECSKLPSTDWLNVVKAFLILAVLMYIIVLIYLTIMVWGKGLTIKLIGIDLIFAAVFSLIAVSVYTCKRNLPVDHQYGWSYVLAWSGSILNLAAAILCFFGDVDYEPMQ